MAENEHRYWLYCYAEHNEIKSLLQWTIYCLYLR
jgi:hypothetical protein